MLNSPQGGINKPAGSQSVHYHTLIDQTSDLLYTQNRTLVLIQTKVINMSIVIPYINEAAFAAEFESDAEFALSQSTALNIDMHTQSETGVVPWSEVKYPTALEQQLPQLTKTSATHVDNKSTKQSSTNLLSCC